MAAILRTIFWNIIAMKTYVIWLKLRWNFVTSIQWTICLHSFSSPRWILNADLLILWLQMIRFPLKCRYKEIYILWICPHTCLVDSMSMYTNTIHLYRSTFYLEGSLYIHLTMPTCSILLYFSHISFFSSDEIKTFIIIIIYELIASGWRMYVKNLIRHSLR